MVNDQHRFLEKIGVDVYLLFGGSSTGKYGTGISLGKNICKLLGDILNRDAPKSGGLERRADASYSIPTKPSTDWSNLPTPFFDYGNLPPAFFDYGAF